MYCEVKMLSEMRGAFRLDAEFWNPEYEGIEASIRKGRHTTLAEASDWQRKGIFYILASDYTESGVPFYRCSNVGSILTKDSNLAYISAERNALEHKTRLRYGDVILAKTGMEAASIVTEKECNTSQDLVGIRVKPDVLNPFYLVAFLNSRFGILQMRRWFQGQVQMHLALPDARKMLIPIASPSIQEQAEKTILAALAKRTEAENLYSEAESILVESLGLANLDLSPSLFYERPYRDVATARRADADFFNPRYQRLLESLAASKTNLSDVATLQKKKFKPGNEGTFTYIEIGEVMGDGTANGTPVEVTEAPSRAQWVVHPGDIITSTVRPIRRLSAIIQPEQDGFVCSSGFAVLRPKGIDPEVLLVYLRLPLVCELLDLFTSASMYPAISVDHLLAIPAPLRNLKANKEITAKVRASFKARLKTSHLLEAAKSTVESAIEATKQG